MTIWHTVAIISLAVIALATLAAFAVMFGTARGRDWPKPPAGGAGTPPKTPRPPGHTHHSGGLETVTKKYGCGCVHTFDGTGRLLTADPSVCRSADWDAELRKLTP